LDLSSAIPTVAASENDSVALIAHAK